jgi:hypothetical protein
MKFDIAPPVLHTSQDFINSPPFLSPSEVRDLPKLERAKMFQRHPPLPLSDELSAEFEVGNDCFGVLFCVELKDIIPCRNIWVCSELWSINKLRKFEVKIDVVILRIVAAGADKDRPLRYAKFIDKLIDEICAIGGDWRS